MLIFLKTYLRDLLRRLHPKRHTRGQGRKHPAPIIKIKIKIEVVPGRPVAVLLIQSSKQRKRNPRKQIQQWCQRDQSFVKLQVLDPVSRNNLRKQPSQNYLRKRRREKKRGNGRGKARGSISGDRRGRECGASRSHN